MKLQLIAIKSVWHFLINMCQKINETYLITGTTAITGFLCFTKLTYILSTFYSVPWDD